MIVSRLIKSIFFGFTVCVLLTVFVSLFALKLNRFLVNIFPFVVASIGSFVCAKYFVYNFKRNRIFYGIISSFIMSIIFTLISIFVWKGSPTKNSLIRMGLMFFSGIIASIEFTPRSRMRRVKIKKQKV